MYTQIPDPEPLLPRNSNEAFEKVPKLMTRFQQAIKDLNGLLDQLSVENAHIQEKYQETRKNASEYSNEIRNLLEKPVDSSKKGRHAKLVQSYQEQLAQFQKVCERGLKKEKEILSQVRERRETQLIRSQGYQASSRQEEFFPEPSMKQKQEQQSIFTNLKEEDVDEKLIQEYNTAIKSTEQDLILLKETFMDVRNLVGEQQEILDVVEKNVVDAEEDAANAVDELKEANVYRQSSRKKIVIISVLRINYFLYLKKKKKTIFFKKRRKEITKITFEVHLIQILALQFLCRLLEPRVDQSLPTLDHEVRLNDLPTLKTLFLP